MGLFKKTQNCLFVEEEESYDWAAPKSSISQKMLYLSLMFVVMGLLFSLLR